MKAIDHERLYDVCAPICGGCLNALGGECHTPGCALWLSVSPDIAMSTHPAVTMAALGVQAARDRVIEAARAAVATAYDAAKPEAAVEAAAEELRAAVRALEALEARDA